MRQRLLASVLSTFALALCLAPETGAQSFSADEGKRFKPVSERDLAVSFSYSGNLDLAERYARESMRYRLNDRGNADVGMVGNKTLGDVAMRRGQYDRAIASYESAIQLSSNSASWQKLAQASLANAPIAKGAVSR